MDKIYLNIGCGQQKLDGFVNIDLDPMADLQIDVRGGLPFDDNSVAGIYSEHFLEHLSQAEGIAFMRECRRALKYDGVLRIAMPDLSYAVQRYLNNDWKVKTDIDKYGYEWIDNACEYLNISMREWGHKWLYDETELVRLVKYAGFSTVQRSDFGKSAVVSAFNGLETRAASRLIIEAIKKRPAQPSAQPMVSIVTPAFNARWFEFALESALNQTYKNIEIIVGDDNPGSEIEEIVSRLRKKYSADIKYLKNKNNLGERGNRINGLLLAKGTYIKFLNDDDALAPQCVERMVYYLNNYPNVTLVTSHRQVIDADGEKCLDIEATERIVSYDSVVGGPLVVRNMVENKVNFVGEPSTVMFRKDDLLDELPDILSFAGRKPVMNGDVFLWMKLLSRGDLVYLTETLSLFRVHSEQAQQQQRSHQKGVLAWEYALYDAKRMGFFENTYRTSINRVSMGAMPNTATIIVTYNSESSIRTCIDSVLENTRIPTEIVVVDNASADGTREILASYGDRITTILNDDNLGFAAACNQGINATGGDYVTLLNPDTLVTPGWLGQLLAHFAPDVGAVGPLSDYVAGQQKFQLYLPENRPAELNLSSLMDLLQRHNHGKAVETKLLIGFCMVLSRAALDEVGVLDESLFLGNDDLDISWRLRNAGYKLLVATDTFVHHEGQVSFKTKAKSKTDALVQQSTDRLYEKLVAYYGAANVPSPAKLWGINWFNPSQPVENATVPLTSIIILAHNQVAQTQACLFSIEKHTPEPHEIIIVDNGSTDDTPSFLRQYKQMSPTVRIIRNEQNAGFAAGNNQALALARGDFILFLNNDTLVTEGWLRRMLTVMAKHPDAGLAGPRSNRVSGPQMIEGVAYESVAAMEDFSGKLATQFDGQSTEFERVVGFCMLVRRAVIDRIGGWDETFPIGNFEDDDFCVRAGLAGFTARIVEDAFVHHEGSQTFKAMGIDYENQTLQNREIFAKKWHLPVDFRLSQNYLRQILADAECENIYCPLPAVADVAQCEVSAKPAGIAVVLNVDDPAEISPTALLDSLPAEAAVMAVGDTTGWDESALARVMLSDESLLKTLARACDTAATVALVSADVSAEAGWLERLTAIAGSDPTLAAVAPVLNHAPAVVEVENFTEEWTPVSSLNDFCTVFNAHSVRVVGGINMELPAEYALPDLYQRLQRFGFQLARAIGVHVHRAQLSVAEDANFKAQMAHKDTISHLLAAGQHALQQNDFDAAVCEFSRAAAENPDVAAVHTALGTTLLVAERFADAVPVLETAAALMPHDLGAKNQLGMAYFQAGEHQKAEAAFQQVLAVDNGNLKAQLFLLELYRAEKRFADAIAHAKNALEIDPTDPDVLVGYGLLMLDMDDLDGAEMAWQELADASTDHPGVLALMSGLLARGSQLVRPLTVLAEVEAAQRAADWARAISLLKGALAAPGAPGAPDEKAALWNRLGMCYFGAENLAEAAITFETGLELAPDDVDLLGNLANVFLQQEQFDRATACINQALKINPSDVNILMLLGNTAIQLNDFDTALMAFQRVQTIAPETTGVGELISQLREFQPVPAAGIVPEPPPGAPKTASSNGHSRNHIPGAPIFIGGAGRSGTTLVRVILDSHPNIACGPEMKILPIIGEMFTQMQTQSGSVFKNYFLTDDAVAVAARHMVEALLTPYLQHSGKQRIAEKTPHNAIFFPQLHQIFPDSPLVHVIRDGRDVVASLLRMDWIDVNTGEPMAITQNVRTAADYWLTVVSSARNAAAFDAGLGQRYFELRYENLVANPEPTLRRLFDFLGEPWDPAVLQYYEQSRNLAAESSREQVSQPLYTHAVGRWQHDLSPEEQAIVKEVAGDLLIDLGYATDKNW